VQSSEPTAVPQWLMTASAIAWRLLVVGGAFYVVALAFGRLQLVIVPVAVALFLSTVLGPPAMRLRRAGLHPLLATWIMFLAALLIIGGIVGGLVPSIGGEFTQLGGDLNTGIKHVEHWLETGPLHLSPHQVTSYVDSLKKALSNNKGKIVQGALSGVTVVLQGVGGVLLTFFLTFFLVKDGTVIGEWIVGLASPRKAAQLRAVGRDAFATLSGYVRGTAANGLINATLLSIGLLIMRVPLVAPIAVLTFVGGFLPLVGAIASGLVAALLALVTRGPLDALVVLGLIVVIHNVEGYLVGPMVLGRAVRLHPIAVLLSLTVGGILGGIVGAFLAVPTTAVALAVNEHYRAARRRAAAGPTAGPRAGPVGPILVPDWPHRDSADHEAADRQAGDREAVHRDIAEGG
jgi:predicted PurR-regulated permease PerM